MKKNILIGCCVIAFMAASFGLLVGLSALGRTGLDGIGQIFIIPSLIALAIIAIEFLIVIGKIKKGLIYSYIVGLIKVGLIVVIIPELIDDIKLEMQGLHSNLEFDVALIAILVASLIPSISNIIKLHKKK